MKRPSLPKALDTKQLQEICMSCGLAKSPPKTALRSRIQIAAKEYNPLPPDARILSIDLGIRNMAFCIIRPRGPAPLTTSSKDKGGQPLSQPTTRYPSAHVDLWKRLSLSLHDTDTNQSKDEPPTPNISATKEDFSPAYMAQIALNFIQTHILPQNPTHILIERQRFRSSSSPAILDWTIRVNTLEAMIYAILAVHQSNGVWKGELVPVAPRRVGTFLLEDNQSTAALMGSSLTTPTKVLEATKKRKIELLGRIIQERDLLQFNDPEAERIGGSIVQRARLGAENDGNYERLAKADDLADCLLQGLAWLEWQRNTANLIKNQAWMSNFGEEVADSGKQVKQDELAVNQEKRPVQRKRAKPKQTVKGSTIKTAGDGVALPKGYSEQVKEEESRNDKQAKKLPKKKKAKRGGGESGNVKPGDEYGL